MLPRMAGDHLLVGRQDDAGQHVAEPVQVLRPGVHHQGDAEGERVLEGRAHERVVDDDQRGVRVPARRLDRAADVHHEQRRVGGRLQVDDAQIARLRDGGVEGRAVPGRHADRLDAERPEQRVEQVLGAAVDRDRVHHAPSGAAQRQKNGRDCRHARIEHRRRLRSVLQGDDLVLQDLGVRVGQAGIDQIDALVRCRTDLSEGNREGAFRRFGAVEDVGRGAEHGRPRRSDGQAGIESARQDGGRRADEIGGLSLVHVGLRQIRVIL